MNAAEMRELNRRLKELERAVGGLPTRITPGGGTGGGGNSNGAGKWVEASSYPGLPDPTDLGKFTMARVTAGPQVDQIYKIAYDVDGETVTAWWQAVGETYTAETKAALENNEYIQKFALGRVEGEGDDNGMVCIRNTAGTGWDAINFFEA